MSFESCEWKCNLKTQTDQAKLLLAAEIMLIPLRGALEVGMGT